MPKIVKPLTAAAVANARPKGKGVNKLSDGFGLFLLVRQNCAKEWRFRYTRPNAPGVDEITLGVLPQMSLADARKKREELRAMVAEGVDPKAEQKRLAEAENEECGNTLFAVAEKWAVIKKTQVQEKTFAKEWRRLENHLFPVMGDLPIEEVNIPVAATKLQFLDEAGKHDTRRKVVGYLREITRFATIHGLLPYNPLTDIPEAFPDYDSENQPTIPPAELPHFLEDLRKANKNIVTKLLIKWQLVTMVRPGESVTAEWADINFDKREWVIPKEKMKGQKRKKRMHIVPLSDQALAILEKMKAINGHCPYVFAGRNNPKTHMNSQTANSAIKDIGYKNRLTAHGMRSIASTYLNDEGADGDVIEACLSHRGKDEVRSIYNKSTFFERRIPVMQQWGDYVESCSKFPLVD
ncbi:DUF4102 domain-containing protein [Testudinibacter sp. TR-2022]|uniref:tyrosine-type recombinase/integrase n=1 Tax=Testudinibacter sp. TR-2022 TaxID=2585029 RepID=UPI00111AAAF6|nr:tyrosine-type recombinase/integrase [Testudinibacter sp. TR-2022]TNH04313.1 DUF4102 domain-containing protein [Pasteurellaceae bacterium Phil31]TNH05744.1 DUF4102 domain-containing protein [Testudinibacter sp. TR-2022]TNH07490.1 DUF4102 domain-containing protein [Testudinibacter sp. TR-2022]